MYTLDEQLSDIVSQALPHLTNEQIDEIVQHLRSDEVGVTDVSDLKDLTLDLMPSLPPLKRRQLLKALISKGTPENDGNEGGSTSANQEKPTEKPNPLSTEHTSNTKQFYFKVVWSDMPQVTMGNLDSANSNKETASPKDIGDLKLAISKKVVSNYLSFREANPGCKRAPGRKVYSNITQQVFSRFNECLKVKVNEKTIGKGDHTFQHLLEVCVENLLRKHSKDSKPVKAKKGKGTVGVKPNEYAPRPGNETEQKGVKQHLQNYYLLDSNEQDLEEVRKDLERTYELQRADIIAAKEDVLEEEENADEVPETALKKLTNEWPFLFRPEMMRQHHDRLTGRDIHLEASKFIVDKLDLLLMYMTSCSNANIQNMALKMNVEKKNVQHTNKVIMALMMVANHFKEDFKSMIFTTERTISIEELDIEQKEPCIITFGPDPILAQKFVVCADRTPLLLCSNDIDALTSLFEVCFVFDLEYPALPQTIEFFERMVFGMGFADTRVEKRGKIVLTLTDSVKKLINGLDNFDNELKKNSE